jgi:hypothetical protein
VAAESYAQAAPAKGPAVGPGHGRKRDPKAWKAA